MSCFFPSRAFSFLEHVMIFCARPNPGVAGHRQLKAAKSKKGEQDGSPLPFQGK
jgi:hypothetical protein